MFVEITIQVSILPEVVDFRDFCQVPHQVHLFPFLCIMSVCLRLEALGYQNEP